MNKGQIKSLEEENFLFHLFFVFLQLYFALYKNTIYNIQIFNFRKDGLWEVKKRMNVRLEVLQIFWKKLEKILKNTYFKKIKIK